MVTVPNLRQRLLAYEPQEVSVDKKFRASVAVVARHMPSSMEILLIQRAHKKGDPWSGQMAFPGGHIEATDASPQAAAERETEEEVGFSLAHGECLGRLDDQHASMAKMVISAFVYVLDPPEIVPNYEVKAALWVPVTQLLNPVHHLEYAYPPPAGPIRSPGIRVGDSSQVVWGITYRFLKHLFEVAGSPLPVQADPSGGEADAVFDGSNSSQ